MPVKHNQYMEITLKLTAEEFVDLAILLNEHAGQLADDGREGNPDAKLLYKVAKQIQLAKKQGR